MAQKQIRGYELMDAFTDNEIKKAAEYLIDNGLIARRRNPNHGYDRTYQYRFETMAVQKAVSALSPMFNIKEWKVQYQTLEALKVTDGSVKSNDTIPHDPSHDPTKDSTPDKASGEPLSSNAEKLIPSQDTPDEPKTTPSKAKNANPWLDAVKRVWDTPNARATTLLSVLTGKSKKHKECNIEPPVTERSELEDFSRWYTKQTTYKTPPMSPEALQHWYYKFRAAQTKRVQSSAPLTADYAAVPARSDDYLKLGENA